MHSARSADVRTTIVDGRVLMRDRELLTVDVPEVVRELAKRLPALTDRGHGRRIQEYGTGKACSERLQRPLEKNLAGQR